MQVLENFNWVDIVIILLIVRYAYLGAKAGLTAELFRLLGTLVSIVVGLHYYYPISNILAKYINIPIWILEFVILFILVSAIKIIFRYGIIMLLKILNIQFISKLERCGGLMVGVVNGFMIIGLALIAVLFFPVKYIHSSLLEKSRLAPYLIKSSEKTYSSVISVIPSQEPRKILILPQEAQDEQTPKPKK